MLTLIIVLVVEIVEIRRTNIVVLPHESELWVLADKRVFNTLEQLSFLGGSRCNLLGGFIDKLLEIGSKDLLEIRVIINKILVDDCEELFNLWFAFKFLQEILGTNEHFLEVWLHKLNILSDHL